LISDGRWLGSILEVCQFGIPKAAIGLQGPEYLVINTIDASHDERFSQNLIKNGNFKQISITFIGCLAVNSKMFESTFHMTIVIFTQEILIGRASP